MRIGIVGFDTSHVVAFTKLLHDPLDPFHVPGGQVVAGYPSYSSDWPLSASRVQDISREMTEVYGITIVDSIEALVDKVDVVLLESADGRRHLAEATPIIRAGKPLFVDKPLASNYRDAATLVNLAQESRCPLFSSSALRFDANIINLQQDPALKVLHTCDVFSPGGLQFPNPGLFWYGIHAVEILYAFMGQGCQSVRCEHSDKYDVVTARWPEGRIATVRAIRIGAGDFGVTLFGEEKVAHAVYSREIPIYSILLQQIISFFGSGHSPVPIGETLEMMAFMEASSISSKEDRTIAIEEITAV